MMTLDEDSGALVRQMEDAYASRQWQEGEEWRHRSGIRNLTFILLVMLVSALTSPALCNYAPGIVHYHYLPFSSYSMFLSFPLGCISSPFVMGGSSALI